MSQIEDALRTLLAGYMRQVRMWPAVIGDAAGVVNVEGQPGWVWVRWSDAPGEQAMRCYNGSKVAAEAGLAVVVGYDFLNPQIFAVLSERLIMPGDKPAPVVGSGADGQLAVWGEGALAGADTLSDALHGALSGGDLHAAATESVAGFMSAEDKTKLDGMSGGGALADLSDVALSGPTNGQALVYDGAAAKWKNAAVSGGGGGVFCGAAVRRTSTYNVGSGTIDYLPFSSAEFDSDSFWSAGNPTRLTAPAAGYYLVTANMRWEDHVDGGIRYICFVKNGDTSIFYGGSLAAPSGAGGAANATSAMLQLSAGDYIELALFQSSGVTLDAYYSAGQFPRMSMVRLG